MPYGKPSALDIALANARETCPTAMRDGFSRIVAERQAENVAEHLIVAELDQKLEHGLSTGEWPPVE